jgi:hypothetical protein
MGQKSRVELKKYFNTGDIPTEAHYADVMDSQLNLTENNDGNIDLTGNITASGHISSSETGLFKKIGIGTQPALGSSDYYDQDVTLHISSSRPRLVVEATVGAPEIKYVGNAGVTGVLAFAEGANLTASADWVSETRFAYKPGASGKPFVIQQVNKDSTKQEPFRVYSGSSTGVFNITSSHIGINTNDVTETLSINGSVSASGNITGSNLKLSGDLDANSLSMTSITASAGFNIGGTSVTATAAELNITDGLTTTTTELNYLDGITSTNATHVKAMNQSVDTGAAPSFIGLTLVKEVETGQNFGSEITTSGYSFTITLGSIPTLAAKTDGGSVIKSTSTTISNSKIAASSCIIANSSADISVSVFRVTDGACKFSLSNETESAFEGGSCVLNFAIL